MNISIIYATTEGHTRTIADFLKNEAEKAAHTADLFDATENPPPPQKYDAIIIAASIHAGKYQSAIEHYVREHHKTLNSMPSLFIPVSLTAAADEPESWNELNEQTEDFLIATGWQPGVTEHTAGALLYTKYDFLKRFLMRVISNRSGGDTDTSRDFIYTDWEKLQQVTGKLEQLYKKSLSQKKTVK
jgi:menaquinone-dependent protoporphyrinogen oxidase